MFPWTFSAILQVCLFLEMRCLCQNSGLDTYLQYLPPWLTSQLGTNVTTNLVMLQKGMTLSITRIYFNLLEEMKYSYSSCLIVSL